MKNKPAFFLSSSLVLLFVFPLFKESISTAFIILTSILTFFYLMKNKIKFQLNKTILLFTIPFFIILFTNLFAVNAEIDWKNISKSLMFLIFPVIFLNIPRTFFKDFESKLIYFFKYSCLAISIYYLASFLIIFSFSDFFKESYNESVFRRYIYNDVAIFKIHPAYFSLFLNVGIVHSLTELKNRKRNLNLFLSLFFLVMILLLSSKMMIVIAFISILYILLKNYSLKKSHIAGVVLFFVVSIFFLPGIKSRFIEAVNDFKTPPKGMYYNSTNIRKSIFDCSVSILKESYITGIGFSNIQNELNTCYKTNYDSSFYENKSYLTHNYFMYIFIGSGIFGFIAFLIYLFFIIKQCIKINNRILNVILYSSLCMFFVEDFLYRHYGLLFFNLFIFSYFKFYEYNQQNILNKP